MKILHRCSGHRLEHWANTGMIWRNWKNTKNRKNIYATEWTAVCDRLYFLKLAKAVYAIQYVPYNMTLTPLLEFKLFLWSACTKCNRRNPEGLFATRPQSYNSISPILLKFLLAWLTYDKASQAPEKSLCSIPNSRVSNHPIATSTTHPRVQILPGYTSPLAFQYFFKWRLEYWGA